MQTKELTNAILKEKMVDAMVDRGSVADLDSLKKPGVYVTTQITECATPPPLQKSGWLSRSSPHATAPLPSRPSLASITMRCYRGLSTVHPHSADTQASLSVRTPNAYSATFKGARRAPLIGRAWAVKSQRGEKIPLLTPLTAFYIPFCDFQPLENRRNM